MKNAGNRGVNFVLDKKPYADLIEKLINSFGVTAPSMIQKLGVTAIAVTITQAVRHCTASNSWARKRKIKLRLSS